MFKLTKEYSFEASHLLPDHDGKCARLHGHSWVFAVVFSGDSLARIGPMRGMLLDYGRISAVVKPMIEELLDHRHLNDIAGLENPTSEVLASWLYHELQLRFSQEINLFFDAVIVHETCTSECEYRP